MTDIDVLESVLRKDVTLLENVRPEQHGDPTPCPEMDVRALTNHLAGFVQWFAARANGGEFDGDPKEYKTDDPVGEFRRGADDLVRGFRATEPDDSMLSITVMEYVTHGTDLAFATGQQVPFTDDEVTVALERAKRTLPPDSRSPETIDQEIPVPDDAPPLDKLLGFMGRS